MCGTPSHIMAPSAGWNSQPRASELGHVTFDGNHACGQDKGQVFIGKQGALFDGFFGNTQQAVLPEAGQPFIFIGLQVLINIMNSKAD